MTNGSLAYCLIASLPIQTQETLLRYVIPAKAGIQVFNLLLRGKFKTWTPAFAGVAASMQVTFFTAFLLTSSVQTLHAEDDPTFVSLTRRPTRISKLPANISVVTAEEIQESGAKSLDEVIGRVVGAQVSHSGSIGTFSSMRLRGVPSSAQMAIVVDDQPYGGFAADQNIDVSQIPIENIERIEVVRGGSSVLYGANTTGGVVHVFTKKQSEGRLSASAGYEGRSYKTKIVRAEAGADTGHLKGIAQVNHFESDGFQQNSDATNLSAYGSVTGILSNNVRIGFDVSDVTHEVGVPQGTAVPISQWDGKKERPAANPTKRSKRDRTEGRFNTDLPWADRGRVKTAVYGSRDEYSSNKSIDPTNDPDFKQVGHVFGGDTRFIGAHGFTGGLAYERDQSRTTSLTQRYVTNIAGYIQQEIPFGKLFLIPAARFDHNGNFGNILNPRFSSIYHATRVWTVSANASRSFRAPSFFDLYFDVPGFYTSNRDLRPETAWTYDLGNEFKVGSQTDIKVVGFYTRIRDRIAGVDRDGDIFQIKETNDNVAKSELSGVEMEFRHQAGFLGTWGNYTYQRSKSPATNKSHFVDIPLNPHHIANVGVDFNMLWAITLTNTVRYVSKQHSVEDRRGSLLPSYATWNARLSKKCKVGEVFVGVNNITDRHYAESFDFAPITFAPTLSPMPVRNYYAGVNVRFASGSAE